MLWNTDIDDISVVAVQRTLEGRPCMRGRLETHAKGVGEWGGAVGWDWQGGSIDRYPVRHSHWMDTLVWYLMTRVTVNFMP